MDKVRKPNISENHDHSLFISELAQAKPFDTAGFV
jgi:hypothetical protein